MVLCLEIQTGPSPPDAPRGQTSPSRTSRVTGKQAARPIHLGAGGQQGLLLAGESGEGSGLGNCGTIRPDRPTPWRKLTATRNGTGEAVRVGLRCRGELATIHRRLWTACPAGLSCRWRMQNLHKPQSASTERKDGREASVRSQHVRGSTDDGGSCAVVPSRGGRRWRSMVRRNRAVNGSRAN